MTRNMKSWKDHYQSRQISAEEAAEMVKSGDLVVFPTGRDAYALGLALAARKGELKGVKVYVSTPGHDFGWYDRGWDDSFEVTVGWPNVIDQEALDGRWVDFDVGTIIPVSKVLDADFVFVELSSPDNKGFCSFGASLWNKKKQIKQAKIVVAEVNEKLMRTYGDNFIHVSEIDYFVPHVSSGGAIGKSTMYGRKGKDAELYLRNITGYVSELIRDGDTIMIGGGRTSEPLVRLGLLDDKHDIGFHSEMTPAGVVTKVREGIITGKYKTINQGKAVATAFGGVIEEEVEWVNNNPLFWMYSVEYCDDIRVITAHDNFVAINNALMVDIRGQIAADNIGRRIVGSAGGQIIFSIGAQCSKGGRAIHVLPSTAKTKDGVISRIVPGFVHGTVSALHPVCAMYIVTEYGIANVWGKTLRQRAEEIISIAHPDFRSELKKEARRMFWPD